MLNQEIFDGKIFVEKKFSMHLLFAAFKIDENIFTVA